MNNKAFTFGKWRSMLWPIHKSEYRKFIPMLAIFFLISFDYNILRAIKDSLIVTSCGAEAIPFIKVWVVLPMAILMTFFFAKMTNRFDTEKVFYIMLSCFLSFFLIFTFVLYPLREALEPTSLCERLSHTMPSGLKGLLALLKNWTYTSYYVMAELWSTTILTVSFWGFANEITTVSEAKRFYGLFSVGANIACALSGQGTTLFSSNHYFASVPYGTSAWDQSILFLNLIIMVMGLVIIAIFRFLHKNVLYADKEAALKEKAAAPKVKMSLLKNFAYLGRSKYLLCIAAVVVTYNLAMNLIEVLWKEEVRQLYPSPSEFNYFMGEAITLIGLIATAIAFFLTGNVLRKFSWTFAALIPPLIMLTTGIGFFAFLLLNHSSLNYITAFLGTTPVMMSVLFGTLQICMSRASKYTLFDATKEMAFIPLTKESKLKGKAAIDGVGSRVGKSSGSVIYHILLITLTSLSASTPYVAAIFLGIIVVWIIAVVSLGRQFNTCVAQHEKIAVANERAAASPQVVAKASSKEMVSP